MSMIVAVRGPGAPGGMVHAATDADGDFTTLCGVTFTAVFYDRSERVPFASISDYDHKHVCQQCAAELRKP